MAQSQWRYFGRAVPVVHDRFHRCNETISRRGMVSIKRDSRRSRLAPRAKRFHGFLQGKIVVQQMCWPAKFVDETPLGYDFMGVFQQDLQYLERLACKLLPHARSAQALRLASQPQISRTSTPVKGWALSASARSVEDEGKSITARYRPRVPRKEPEVLVTQEITSLPWNQQPPVRSLTAHAIGESARARGRKGFSPALRSANKVRMSGS